MWSNSDANAQARMNRLCRLIEHGDYAAAAAAVAAYVGDINEFDWDGWTALCAAVNRGHPETIAALASRGDWN